MAAMGGAWFSSDMSFSGDFRMENTSQKIKALRVLMGTAVFKRSSLQIGRFLVWYLLYNLWFS